ncbi:MAG: zinc ribbon domain-containing protein [Ruminococcus sp.]|nr:zinc ribbon domain-containing protein [Ruminococcus sp.]
MICKNCGRDNDDNDLFCRNCGKELEKNNRPKINLSKNGVTKPETTETFFSVTPTDENISKVNIS